MSNGQTGIVGTIIRGCNKVLIMATILPRDNFVYYHIRNNHNNSSIIIIVQHLKYDTLYFRPKHCNDLIISFVLILCLFDVMGSNHAVTIGPCNETITATEKYSSNVIL